jgi:2-dehydro-3-deoxyphosphogluconate aldolase/(4S)-4-hydroxy-2-oxoglutarate aldolase
MAMRTRQEIISSLTRPGIIAVVRVSKPDQVAPLSEALIAGGVIAIEITLTTPNALEAISRVARQFGARAVVGVGTVLDPKSCQAALDAGAEFVVSPILRTELVAAAHGADKPVMLGAYTPTEAQLAHEAGADFVKIFPADGLGPAYIRAIRAPLPHLRIVPTGGVDLTTATEFLKAGCAALGVGSSLMTRDILSREDWPELTRLAGKFVALALASRTG